MKHTQIIKLGFQHCEGSHYVIVGDIGDLDFWASDMEISMGSNYGKVRNISHLKRIVKNYNNLWQSIQEP